MPVLFVGHGSPMNALENNDFTRALGALGRSLPRPKAILCVSAHWMTEGTWVTRMENPRTIHDFYGFPKELFDIRYPAPGSLELADRVKSIADDPEIHADEENWGLDHGSWSVLRHLYPKADIPVAQLSVYLSQPGEYHTRLGFELRSLREQGVLILGSGNIVHNLRQIRWEQDAKPFDWAVEFDEWVKQRLLARDAHALLSEYLELQSGRLSVPTPDHYYPLLTVFGASDAKDEISFPYEEIQNGSISMRAVCFGSQSL